MINCLSTPRLGSSQKFMKYTDLATRREENSKKGRNIRILFSRLNELSGRKSQGRDSRVQLGSLTRSKILDTTITGEVGLRKSVVRQTLARRTVGSGSSPHFY